MINIGVVKETKHPIDNRVLFSPTMLARIQKKYNGIRFFVESSNIRCFSDEEYKEKGISIATDLSSCDILFGIKEVAKDHLIPSKHYFFFGHIGKMQEYNKPLIREMIQKKITFTDYEYLVNKLGKRVCAFGYWAGFVGIYNSIRAYGIKMKSFNLPRPNDLESKNELLKEVNALKKEDLPNILITGGGQVAKGGIDFLSHMKQYKELSIDKLKSVETGQTIFFVNAQLKDLVKNKAGKSFNREDFRKHPQQYESRLMEYMTHIDVFISAHYWEQGEPIYLSTKDLKQLSSSLKVVADITCDIDGSIKCTTRASTHDSPFYDYNPFTNKEEEAFSDNKNITVMAVDTLPNALPKEASENFGLMFFNNVLDGLLGGDKEQRNIIERATILRDGVLSENFSYLFEYTKE
ncbi:hypothetical protein HR11_08530 [Porphyromonas macacae]|uniref:NAD(P)-dependent oxidoreductase n=1 Tax=Porphyromonas macacae TaxID=28115 RepID=UPI00052D0FCB|nr:NAD(P)-dependent oxidoreductase [Porphyromonas macacae]KGN98568.1 hypothetical protein HR11_08530 [Porphyromonas macacae]